MMLPEDSFGAATMAAIASQLGASLSMLDNAIAACPDVTWDDGSAEGFRPLSSFGLEELDPASVLLLYAMRHVQHHAGQLNQLLHQRTGVIPRWVAVAR